MTGSSFLWFDSVFDIPFEISILEVSSNFDMDSGDKQDREVSLARLSGIRQLLWYMCLFKSLKSMLFCQLRVAMTRKLALRH
ncbi:hypothetical protein J1N35_010220 [Gossypium stocksii]|uniref:Uncharacterized protein n=1 Tax=Gossypium stocksii TaxID=47602 RepID=A0A9D4AAB7_9ROSI|nr:hypothetical protein J1N35_010220 [Gossypium stocksii]